MVLKQAVKIIDIDSSGDSFVLDEPALRSIFESVPEDMPVAIVSVVGGFRTGKSFLLDFFLHYLRTTSEKSVDTKNWLDINDKIKGNVDGEGYTSKNGFAWKHGSTRCTTGIWLWSEYFIRKVYDDEKGKLTKSAVFLMDTQGMFDRVTGQHLTASIFGLSTLISSYTIYNLIMEIQEDHLQHLALFAEYARVALTEQHGKLKSTHPFQKLEFLVRDYRNLDVPDDEINFDDIHDQSARYLAEAMASSHKDTKEVRDQIQMCFEEINCSLLPYPGMNVTEKRRQFDGSVSKISEEFRILLEDFVYRVFNQKIVAKKILGEPVKALQLFEHVKVYCKLFQESEIFPEAKTLFRATQEANIMYAIGKSERAYKTEMDKVVGIGAAYMDPEELLKHHKEASVLALEEYKNLSKIGGTSTINKEGEDKLKEQILERLREYKEANKLRDPWSFVGPYIVPFMIAVVAYIARYVLETVCPRRSYACWDVADFFGSMYTIIISFLLFHILSTLYGVRGQLANMVKVVKPKSD